MSTVEQPQPMPRLLFQLPLDAARLLRARERVRDYLRALCSDEDLVDDVVLCVEEACTNAIRHSEAHDAMDVSLVFRDDALSVNVRDRGKGFDVETFDPSASPDPLALGGRGLFLIASLMDEVHLRVSGGLHVRMVKHGISDSCTLPDLAAAVPHSNGLQTRQSRLRALLEEIDEAFVALDWEYRVVHANEAAARLAGATLEGLAGRPALEVWPQLRGADAESSVRDAMELGRSSVLDWLGGDDRWREMRVYPTFSGVSVYVRDIDARKRAELAGEELLEELRSSEERFRATFEQAGVGMVHITLDGRYERVNERFCDLVGYTRAELERMTYRDLTHGDDVEREQHYLDALADGSGSSYAFEKRYIRRDGGLVWASVTVSLVHDAHGAPAYIMGVVQDVGPQKRAADILKRYELLSDQARDIMLFVRERDGAIMEANRAATDAYGYTRDELLRLSVFDLRGRELPETIRRQMLDAWSHGVLFETTHRRADGSEFPVEVSSKGSVREGHEPILLSVVRDVSERTALGAALARERDVLATVIENTGVQVAYLDDEFRFLIVNDALLDSVGADRDSLIGRSALEILGPESHDLFARAKATGEPVERPAEPHESALRPERGVTYWDWRLVPLKGSAGVQGFVLSRADVTERVRRGLYTEGLNAVLERLGESRDPDRLGRILAEGIRRVLGADGWSLWEYDGEDAWTLRQADGRLGPFIGQGVAPAQAVYAEEARRSGAVVTAEDCRGGPLGCAVLADLEGARSLIAAPLPGQDPFTVLFFSWQRSRTFTRAEADFVTRAAATAAHAMSDARLYRELAERERFAVALNEISSAVDSLLDVDEILDGVVRRVREALVAESCVVSMLESESWVPRYASGVPEGLLGVPIPREQVSYANVAVDTKRAVAVDDCSTDPRVDVELQRAWGVRSVMMAPLVVRDEVIGGVFLNYHDAPHRFGRYEVEFVSNVAAVISGALEVARLYQRERHVATTLQEVFLHTLPRVSGLELAVTSERAYKPDLVGGDFYDAFEVEGGRVAVVVGDVEGKGVRAAGLTETVRSAIRALALVDASPAFILGRVNEVLLREMAGQFVTAALIVVDPATGEAVHASAGHPPALVLSRDSCGELDGASGTPLGTFAWEFRDETLRLHRDDVVVLYTDGLTELRVGREQFGVERALQAACRLTGGSLDDLVTGLRDAAVAFGGQVRDDMAIVAFRLNAAGDEARSDLRRDAAATSR